MYVCDSHAVTRDLTQSRVLCALSCSRICCARHSTSCTYIHKCSGAGGSAARLDEPLRSRTRGLLLPPPPNHHSQPSATHLSPPQRIVVRSEEESEGNGHAESDSDESTSKPHSKSTRDGAPHLSCLLRFLFIYLFIYLNIYHCLLCRLC
jgi:hypothetical protein